MSLLVRVHCGYPSYADSGEEWGWADFDAYKLVSALKGKPINGYATLQKANGQWVRITAANPEPAFALFGEWGSAQVTQLQLQHGLIIPVPSSDCLALGQDAKGRRLAQEIANRLPNFEIFEGLHWGVKLPKASEGGPRDVPTLYANLRIAQNIPKRPIVLVDDVTTGGGHLLACAQGLRAFDHSVEHAICAARTVHSHPPNGMFNLPDVELEPA